jgi:hypothetical protein
VSLSVFSNYNNIFQGQNEGIRPLACQGELQKNQKRAENLSRTY